MHPGCKLRASRICSIPCAHPLPRSLLRASVTMAFLVACISVQNDPCMNLFQKWPLRASVFQSLNTNIRIRTSETLVFTTGVLQQRMTRALNAYTVRVLDNATLWLLVGRFLSFLLSKSTCKKEIQSLIASTWSGQLYRQSPDCFLRWTKRRKFQDKKKFALCGT